MERTEIVTLLKSDFDFHSVIITINAFCMAVNSKVG